MSTGDDNGEQATAPGPGPRGGHRNHASRDFFGAGRDIHLDKGSGQNVSGQHVEVHIVNQAGQGGAAPDGGAGFSKRQRRPWLMATLAIGAAAVLLIVAVVTLVPSKGPNKGRNPVPPAPLTTVQLLGNDVLFSDPNVEQALRQQGLVVNQTLPDSRTICSDTKAIEDYDISDTSKESASCYEGLVRKAGKTPDVSYPYEGLMVIATYTPIVRLLERLHIAYEDNGITIFNVAQYLKVFASGERWTDIPGNTAYPSKSRILLWTTNPKESNLGGMLADIAYAAQTGGNQPTSIGPDDPHLPVITSLFTELGELPTYSVDLLNQFLGGGMAEYPMAMFYESQYLSAVLTGIATDPLLTMMYPTPDVSTEDALVAWTPAGQKLIAALRSKPMAALMAAEGYRTVADKGGFVAYMHSKGLTVPDLDDLEKEGVQFSNVPTNTVLTKLINVVAASQPG